ncbi:MAG: hypothetical protein DPW14_09705 [Planctomycetes bacterium]|nr:hypothetical protein [Planctomycetota bacterium]
MDRHLIRPLVASICVCVGVLTAFGCVAKEDNVKSLTERANEYKASQPDLRKKFWPSGRIKEEWTESGGFEYLRRYHENGVLSEECVFSGTIAGIRWWDEDGVLRAATYHMMFTTVDLSRSTDASIRDDIEQQFVMGPEGAYLRRSSLSDVGLMELVNWTRLSWVDITGCKNITQRAIDEFKRALPNCEVRR